MNDVNLYNSVDVADKIKNCCKSKNVTAKTMLADLGLGSNAMSAMRHGKAMASDSLARIADYLDCSVDYLLGRTDCESISQSPADSVSFDPQGDRMMDAFMQLDADNRDIVLGKAKELLKEQRYEEGNGDIRLAK